MLRRMSFAWAALLLFCTGAHGEKSKSQDLEVSANSAEYITYEDDELTQDELVPVRGWTRLYADSARSIKGWARWWKYLGLKQRLVMKWKYGLSLVIYPGNEMYRALFVRGIYNPNLAMLIRSLLFPGSVFIDVGANFGDMSLLASRIVGSNGHVYALEPSSRDFERLRENVNRNGLQDSISTYRLALFERSQKVQLRIAGEERSGLNTLGLEISSKGVEEMAVEEVEACTLDEFVAKEKILRVDLLKLDIEGSELYALRGAARTILNYRPVLVLGVNHSSLKSCGADYSSLQRLIHSMKYKMYGITEKPAFALEPIQDLTRTGPGIVVCLPEGIATPTLPQPSGWQILGKKICAK
ncbi:MAG: FkbM family methyltransferase [Holosporaceae bacterium]|nr:FkbM family methyltransferase [Holosporaceae bacterium]